MQYMWSFLDRLINLCLPCTTDFQGINPRSFDRHGNHSLGLTDQGAFPELENMGRQKGMDVNIKTTANTDDEATTLFSLLGMPFEEKEKEVVHKKKSLKKHHFLNKNKNFKLRQKK